MQFGVNLLLFSDQIDKPVMRHFGKLREFGFDGLELPIFAPKTIDVDAIRKQAERYELKLTVSGAPPPGSRFYGKDKAARAAAEEYTRDVINVTADLGASVLCGPLFKPVGDTDDSMPLPAQRRETARAFAPLARLAEESGVLLAFEPLNRFETNLLNTTADSIAFAKAIGTPAAKLLLDTFHMHIEEKNTPAALRDAMAAGVLGHVHFSENDRGTVGSGQVRWTDTANALAEIGYDGWVVLESFCQDNQAIRRAVSCWRPFFDSPLEFCEQGINFAKTICASAKKRGRKK